MGTWFDKRSKLSGALGAVLVVAVGVLLVVAILAVPLARPAAAHARLVSTDPADDEMLDQAPEQIELRFDEPVEVAAGSIQVIGPDGTDMEDGSAETVDGGEVVRVALVPSDQQGTYTVAWRVTSRDTHVLTGSFVFHVGERTGAAVLDDAGDTLIEVTGFLGRWLAFLGSAIAVGAALLAATGDDPRVRDRLRLVVGGAAIVAVVGVGVAFVSRVGEITGTGLAQAVGEVPDTWGTARTVELMGWRLGLLTLMAAAVLVGWVWRRSPLVTVVCGAGAIVSTGMAGHAWTSNRQALAVVSDITHYGAASVWVGGLVALLVVLPVAAEPAAWSRRFSQMALGAAVLVGAAGTVLAWQQLDSIGELTSTGYGRLLAGKALLFAVLVGFGWLNRARLVDLVERTVMPLSRSLRAEVGVAVVVLALTAGLVNTPPARTIPDSDDDSLVAAESFAQTVVGDTSDGPADAELHMGVLPARSGDNELHLNFSDGNGEPLEMVIAQAEVWQGDLPPRQVALSLLTPTHAFAEGVALPSPGTWTVAVTARPLRGDEPIVFTFEVPIT